MPWLGEQLGIDAGGRTKRKRFRVARRSGMSLEKRRASWLTILPHLRHRAVPMRFDHDYLCELPFTLANASRRMLTSVQKGLGKAKWQPHES